MGSGYESLAKWANDSPIMLSEDLARGMFWGAEFDSCAANGAWLTMTERELVAMFKRIRALESNLAESCSREKQLTVLLKRERDSHSREVGGVDLT
jgi:hypothetical protein